MKKVHKGIEIMKRIGNFKLLGKEDTSKPFLTIKVEWIIKAYLTGSLK